MSKESPYYSRTRAYLMHLVVMQIGYVSVCSTPWLHIVILWIETPHFAEAYKSRLTSEVGKR